MRPGLTGSRWPSARPGRSARTSAGGRGGPASGGVPGDVVRRPRGQLAGRLHARRAGLGDTFIVYYSSGTTGLPKAAEHTHDGVLWNAFGQVDGLRLTRRVRYAVIPSLSWAAGFHNLFIALTWVGGYSEILRTGGANADNLVDLLVREDHAHLPRAEPAARAAGPARPVCPAG
jgi:acyl-CoA synthetase (AMP-forming)/AMP-acid ligase II